MVPGIVYSWSWTILLDELEMYQFFATLSESMLIFSKKISLVVFLFLNFVKL